LRRFWRRLLPRTPSASSWQRTATRASVAGLRLSVERTARDLRTRTQQPVEVRVAYGDTVTSICAVARETHAAVIAMATHGRGGLRRFVCAQKKSAYLSRTLRPW
jgi:nucleotide-binding universal stress UspA family protein